MNNSFFDIDFATSGALWTYRTANGQSFPFAPPQIEIDGASVVADVGNATEISQRVLPHGVREHVWRGDVRGQSGLELQIKFQIAPDNPVARFCYELQSTTPRRLTKSNGQDDISYFGLDLAKASRATEVRFSDFRETVHSFCLSETPLHDGDFANARAVMGPMLVASDGQHSFLAAYEHGSQVPDAFLQFHLSPSREVTLRGAKGNYFNGQIVALDAPFDTLWFEFAAVEGDEDALAHHYRDFALRYLSPNTESRKPYIFYNTWNFQERNKAWYQKPYLGDMNETRMLAEIEVAHRMGVEVFVIDTGWYQKTGDWQVNLERFPGAMKNIKAKLDSYGMKLGLWFNPCAAAQSSQMLKNNRDCVRQWNGKEDDPWPVWETEESHQMCLTSRYADAFADELIRLVRKVGVTYFKWDAVGLYNCDAAGHFHGDESVPASERANCQAFNQGRAMTRIIDKLCAACPESIVDFDITEGGRYVGLGFLAAGKFFLINNGPYYPNYDLPTPPDGNVNIFFWPGPARAWICREPLTYDKWLPSVLFLTHYLPDDPAPFQMTSIASLILGGNGIWGDLLRVSQEGIALHSKMLTLYKQVRDDITRASPVRSGAIAGSPEVHEKISEGRGVVCLFATARGQYEYVTQNVVSQKHHVTEGAQVVFDDAGRAKITASFKESGAQIVFFGVQ